MESLIFHFRPEIGFDHIHSHTYYVKCINKDKTENPIFYIGYSVVHPKDQFCRKIGRELAEKKAQILEMISDDKFYGVTNPSALEPRVHESVRETFGFVIEASMKVFKMDEDDQVEIKIFAIIDSTPRKTRIPIKMWAKINREIHGSIVKDIGEYNQL